MAHKCNTEDDGKKWNSKVKGNPDGKFEIKKEDSKGLFSGKHEVGTDKFDLYGKCFEASGGNLDRIWFVVPETDHLYIGDIDLTGADPVITGHRFVIDVASGDVHLDPIAPAPPDADDGETAPPQQDEWVATKT